MGICVAWAVMITVGLIFKFKPLESIMESGSAQPMPAIWKITTGRVLNSS